MSSDDRIARLGKRDRPRMTGLVLIVGFLTLLAAGCGGESISTNGSGGGGPVPATVSGTIDVGEAGGRIAVDTDSDTIYVALFGSETNSGQGSSTYCPGVNGTVTTIDGATQFVATSGLPPAGAQYPYENPLDLAVNSANHTVYIAARLFSQPNLTCYYWGGLQVFNSGTLAQTATDTALMRAASSENVAVNQQTGNIYWSDWEGSTVEVLDADGNLLKTISLASRPVDISANPVTNKIYVAATYPTVGVIVIDGATDTVITTVTDPLLGYPQALAVNPATNMIYVANALGCSGSSPSCDSVVVISGTTDSVTSSIPAGNNLADIAVDPQTNFIYVANLGVNNQAGSVIVVDGTTGATTTLIDAHLNDPFHVAVNPTTNKVYVTDRLSNSITVIDGAHD